MNEIIQRDTFPTIVCLCGSTRFFDEFRRQNLCLTLEGKIVLSIGCDTKADGDIAGIQDLAQVKADLDKLHRDKIRLADEVLVLNVGGYIGDSTRSEIAYAAELGKPVRYLDERAALLALHEYDELIFGGFICTHCTPNWEDGDDPDDNVAWPCPSLRAIGVTDEEAIAIIKAHRAEIEAKAAQEAGAR